MDKTNCFTSADKFYIDKNIVWFISIEDNYLMKRDQKTGICEVIDSVPDSNGYRWCSECIRKGDFVYCLPNRANSLYIYSLKEHTWTKQIRLEEKDRRLTCELVIEQEDCFWFISRGNCKLYKYNIIEGKVFAKDLRIEISARKNVDYQFFSNVIVENEELYFGLMETNVIVKYNYKNDMIMTFDIPISDGIWRIQKNKEYFYLIGHKKALYEWNIENNKIRIIDNFPHDFGGIIVNNETKDKKLDIKLTEFKLPLFNHPVCHGNEVWLIPYIGNEILLYNCENCNFTMYTFNSKIINSESRIAIAKYNLIYYIDSRYLGIYSNEKRVYIEIDLENKTDKVIEMSLTSEELAKLGILEEERVPIKLFLEWVTN